MILNDLNEPPQSGIPNNADGAANKTLFTGKNVGATTYKPAENKKMIEVTQDLKITSSEGEKGKIWPIFVNMVAREMRRSS